MYVLDDVIDCPTWGPGLLFSPSHPTDNGYSTRGLAYVVLLCPVLTKLLAQITGYQNSGPSGHDALFATSGSTWDPAVIHGGICEERSHLPLVDNTLPYQSQSETCRRRRPVVVHTESFKPAVR